MPVKPKTDLLVNRQNLPFKLDDGIARHAALGLVVLATDHTIEHEWRQMLRLDGVAFYESRIANDADITPETLRRMKRGIAGAAALIRPGERLDVLAFGCTSGAMVLGEKTVFAKLRESRPEIPCTSPVTAALAAFEALRANRIALITPYVDEINHMMRDWFETRGIGVPVMGSFNHGNDNEVARITAKSIETAVLELGGHEAVDAVFVSCTSLRVAELVESLELRLNNKPVSSSNHAMAWHALRLAGYKDLVPGFGKLMRI